MNLSLTACLDKERLLSTQIALAPTFTLTMVGGSKSARLQLDEWVGNYLARCPTPFPLQFPLSFYGKVLCYLQSIPFGQTRSYSQIAEDLGNPGAARAVGGACKKNPYPFIVPCHRVVTKNGGLGGFSCGLEIKKMLLSYEMA